MILIPDKTLTEAQRDETAVLTTILLWGIYARLTTREDDAFNAVRKSVDSWAERIGNVAMPPEAK